MHRLAVVIALVAALVAALSGCDWIRLHVKGSEHGVDWGVGVPL